MHKSYLFVGISAFVTWVGCGDDSGSNQTTGASTASLCEQLCTRATAKHCGTETQADCESNCHETAARVPSACVSLRDEFLTCGAKASFKCDDATHDADAIGCLDELSALQACAQQHAGDVPASNADAALPSSPDAGTGAGADASTHAVSDAGRDPFSQVGSDASVHTNRDAGTPGTSDGGLSERVCAPAADDDACTTCIHAKCCDALTACVSDAACASVGQCVSACADGDDACLQACADNASDDAVGLFNASLACSQTACPSECGGGSSVPNNGEPDNCLPTGVPAGYCTDPARPVGHECTSKPEGDCVLLPNVADVYCCAR